MPQDMVPLARITPERRIVTVPPLPKRALTPRQKAAVIVRYLLTEGSSLPLSSLPEHMQAALAERGNGAQAAGAEGHAGVRDREAARKAVPQPAPVGRVVLLHACGERG